MFDNYFKKQDTIKGIEQQLNEQLTRLIRVSKDMKWGNEQLLEEPYDEGEILFEKLFADELEQDLREDIGSLEKLYTAALKKVFILLPTKSSVVDSIVTRSSNGTYQYRITIHPYNKLIIEEWSSQKWRKVFDNT